MSELLKLLIISLLITGFSITFFVKKWPSNDGLLSKLMKFNAANNYSIPKVLNFYCLHRSRSNDSQFILKFYQGLRRNLIPMHQD